MKKFTFILLILMFILCSCGKKKTYEEIREEVMSEFASNARQKISEHEQEETTTSKNKYVEKETEFDIHDVLKNDDKNSKETQIETKKQEETQIETEKITVGKSNALKKAKTYIDLGVFNISKDTLKQMLILEKFSEEEAEYAVNNINVNWKEYAYNKAKDYIEIMAFSRQGLIDQLIYEGFTEEEANYAADKIGY